MISNANQSIQKKKKKKKVMGGGPERLIFTCLGTWKQEL